MTTQNSPHLIFFISDFNNLWEYWDRGIYFAPTKRGLDKLLLYFKGGAKSALEK
jgi:hypothetical protein